MQKNQVRTYDILISLIVLFLFLGFLSFRMAWKIDYRFNNELVNICDSVTIKFESLNTKIENGKLYRLYDDAYFEEMNYYYAYVDDIYTSIEEGKISVRSDYAYAVNQVREDIDILKDYSYYDEYGSVLTEDVYTEMDNKKVAAYNDLNSLLNWHKAYFVFGFIFIAFAIVCVVAKIFKVKLAKRTEQNI